MSNYLLGTVVHEVVQIMLRIVDPVLLVIRAGGI